VQIAHAPGCDDRTVRAGIHALTEPGLHARARGSSRPHPLRVASAAAQAEPDEGLRPVGQPLADADPDRKAPACSGLPVGWWAADGARREATRLRSVDARPVRGATPRFLACCCPKLEAAGQAARLPVGADAAWHTSRAVRARLRAHHRQAKQTGRGVRRVAGRRPGEIPGFNPLEPEWAHGPRRVVEPARPLTARELAERVCAAFDCPYADHLAMPEKVA